MSESKNLNHKDQRDLSNESSTRLKISTKQSKYWADEMSVIYQLDSHGANKKETTIAEMYYHLRSRGFTL